MVTDLGRAIDDLEAAVREHMLASRQALQVGEEVREAAYRVQQAKRAVLIAAGFEPGLSEAVPAGMSRIDWVVGGDAG